jgi:hypothetical protein
MCSHTVYPTLKVLVSIPNRDQTRMAYPLMLKVVRRRWWDYSPTLSMAKLGIGTF